MGTVATDGVDDVGGVDEDDIEDTPLLEDVAAAAGGALVIVAGEEEVEEDEDAGILAEDAAFATADALFVAAEGGCIAAAGLLLVATEAGFGAAPTDATPTGAVVVLCAELVLFDGAAAAVALLLLAGFLMPNTAAATCL